jgi:hypothetical protein
VIDNAGFYLCELASQEPTRNSLAIDSTLYFREGAIVCHISAVLPLPPSSLSPVRIRLAVGPSLPASDNTENPLVKVCGHPYFTACDTIESFLTLQPTFRSIQINYR